MRKTWLILPILLISLLAVLSLPVTGEGEIKADIAYVLVNSNGIDQYLLNEFSSLGYTYKIIYESQVASTDFTKYRMIVVGNQKLSNSKNIPIDKYKTLVINSHNYYRKTTSDYQLGLSKSSGTKTSPTSLKIYNYKTEIIEGLPDSFNAYTITSPDVKTSFLNGQKATGTRIIISSNEVSDGIVSTLEEGDTLLNGKKVQRRILFFGITKPQYWTNEAKTLFENSVYWILSGEDFDEDGFLSDVDCNDLNKAIYPGAVEIPYDGIDQDCSGGDLVDIDKDGYTAQVVGGADCNDLDASINPSNPNPYYNCLNDAPIIQPILKLTFSETQKVTIVVNAEDPEGDIITYSINDARFSKSGNVFTWQTGYEDGGQYSFMITVSDSKLSSQTTVNIEVGGTNRAPGSSIIPNIQFNEDSTYTIDIRNYFSDADSDPLTFGVFSQSQYSKVSVTSTQNGIFTLTPQPNFNGQEQITFKASDGKAITQSNSISINVAPVNDAPAFASNIQGITWNEDSNLISHLNLNNHFSDIDSQLVFSVSGNNRILIQINGSLVSFFPEKDFYGTETIKFTSSDGEFSRESNLITLTILDRGEPPEFQPLTCEAQIEEDSTSTCILEAADFEGNDFTFSVISSNRLNCNINGDELTYTPVKDYAGTASCTLSVSDIHGSTTKTFSVEISPINDAPTISKTPDSNIISIIEGRSQKFSAITTDIDSSEITMTWKLDGEIIPSIISFTSDYVFSLPLGSYFIQIFAQDEEYVVEENWTAIVGPISDFTCGEAGGFELSKKQVCYGEILGVKDTDSCCSVEPSPSFDSESCKILNSGILIDITKPEEGDGFEIEDTIEVKLEIENNYEKEQRFNVQVFLYDLEEDESLVDEDEIIKLEAGESETTEFELDIPEDIDDSHTYYLFAKAEDDICNQRYVELDIERPEEKIIISEFEIPETAACGSFIEARVKVENQGSEEQDITISVLNNELNIEDSIQFPLEEFEEDDSQTEYFSFLLPSNIHSGIYTMRAAVQYNSNIETSTKNIEVQCETQEFSTQEPTILNQNADNKILNQKAIQTKEKELLFYFMLFFEVTLVAMMLALYFFSKAKRNTVSIERQFL